MKSIYFSKRKKIKKQKATDYKLYCDIDLIEKRYTILKKCSDTITAICGDNTLTFIPYKNNIYKLLEIK